MLKCANYILFLMLIFAAENISAQNFIKVDDGVVVYPGLSSTGNVYAVKLQVYNDKIIRVIASATDSFQNKSLIILNQSPQKINFTVNDVNDSVQLKTNALIASVNKQTGTVSFYDLNGKSILKEKEYNSNSLTPAVFEGEPLYNIEQTFTTTNDDALYGLGQHQDGIVNYRNNQEFLWQNNTEVAVPLLVSSKNYGILWDNYSLTTFGDIRPFQPLSSLKLYSKDDEYGFLTASYFNNKNDSSKPDFIKAESDISYPYLNDTKQKLPANFNIANGKIVWEGSISSDINGDHTFRFFSAGYFKVWIDGNLVVDKWRQAWNPGNTVIHTNFEAGKKYAIKMEWIPDGGESYLSAKCLTPIPSSQINDYSFSSEAGRQLDYYFIYGNNADDVIAGYRTLTGKATIAPQWAMGFWQSRERYKTQDEILNTMAEFRKRKIPIDNIVLDWNYWREQEWGSQEFDETRFPNADSMINVLHNKYNAHFMISVWPKFYEGINTYNDFKKHGWLYTRNIADSQRDWIAQGYVSTFYDAFNAEARKGFWDLINDKLYKKGIDAWWMDASEPDILSNVSPAKKKRFNDSHLRLVLLLSI